MTTEFPLVFGLDTFGDVTHDDDNRATLIAVGASRFDLKYGMGGLSHRALMTNIELYGTQVIPRVRELLVIRN